ncbi:serine/threonine protein kinase [Streptomyces phaeoluteigriseus]|uniref:Serine/threonine protein kinase n=1 Tax=Streptomyces phaeoluteigriseus TaxID=114686 RepID=A0ABY4ZDF0_9ACTN|nr:lipopolysaccharide kinase InaA family protein [Streptomyces phaeoluteigriseus]USQ87024.1 serine/threonine protein kinase [Streptomyces phaeoluteigriseus]
MKKGDVIGGYRITSEPTNANGGKCVWAFAEKDGGQYFVKRFLEPKRPRDDDTRDTPSLRIRRQLAREFEERHRTIMKRLRPDARGGGNLVLATDFFHEGSTYYKVTERIDTSSLEKPQSLEPRQKMVLLKTLGMSLKQLHDIGIVHGDLKPLNVLVQKRDGAAFHTAKLIDFDDSYVAGDPPGPEEIAGDSLYGAPEWRRYMRDDGSVGGEQLTCAVDVFALGLMTHLYLTGELPHHDKRYGSPADAVDAGEQLELDIRLSDTMLGLVRSMTGRAPAGRPRMATFLKTLSDPSVCALQHRRPGSTRPSTATRPKSGGAAGGRTPSPDTTKSAGATTSPGTTASSGATPSGTKASSGTTSSGATASSGTGPRTSRIKSTMRSPGRPGGSGGAPRVPRPATEPGRPPAATDDRPATPPTAPDSPPPARPASPPPSGDAPAPRASRVRINLGDRRRDRDRGSS